MTSEVIDKCCVTSNASGLLNSSSSGCDTSDESRSDHGKQTVDTMIQPKDEYEDNTPVETFEVRSKEALELMFQKEERISRTSLRSIKCHYCSQCGNSFSLRPQLTRHMLIHSGDKPYPCSQCPMRFRTKESLLEHTRVHTGDRPHVCDQCGKGFIRPGRLQIHRRIHSGEKPHECSQCGKSFKCVDELQRHVRLHTGQKPFHCAQCDKSFTRSGQLSRHVRLHTGERPYQCTHCVKSFSRAEHLRGHQINVHREQTPERKSDHRTQRINT